MDGGFNSGKTQGLKHKIKGRFGNTFQLRWTAGLFWKTAGALLQNNQVVAVSSDVDRWITIPWPRAKRGSDLIYAVHTRSNGSERKGGKSPAATIGCGGASPARLKPVIRARFWAAGWCKGTRAVCVTHWGLERGSGMVVVE